MSETHTLSLRSIKKDYEGKPLLKGLSFEVTSGEVLCLLGRSGSGKSTLLRIIAGIENADSGNVFWDGQSVDAQPTHLRHFGLMFQDYALFPHRNVAENVAFGLRMQGLPREEIDRRVTASLDQVNMCDFAARRVTDLSGGEQQRVALARALAPQPRLLMLDEPLSALDRTLREQLQQELREVLRRTGIPTIYVTHDQEEALVLGDRMALLHDGEIVQIGAPEIIYHQPHNRWVADFLGMQNILEGKVISNSPLQVQTAAGSLFANLNGKPPPAPGDKIVLVITPAADFTHATPGEINCIQGTCISCLFKGENYQIQLSLSDSTTFTYRSSQPHKKGEALRLWLPSENVVCLTAD